MPFKIWMKIKANREITDPIFAYSIKNIRGVEVTGTNTMYNKIITGTIQAGKIIEVTFTQQIPLQPDGYLLSLGCTGYNVEEF
jgi:teichoic acid transport system ATP-binding protein